MMPFFDHEWQLTWNSEQQRLKFRHVQGLNNTWKEILECHGKNAKMLQQHEEIYSVISECKLHAGPDAIGLGVVRLIDVLE